MPAGRPSKYSDELVDKICDWIASGKTLTAFCNLEGSPNYATIMRWLDKEPEFRDKYVQARESQAEHFNDRIIDIADDMTIDADHKRIQIDARKWSAAHAAPKKYGERRIIAGDPEAPVAIQRTNVLDVSKLSIEQLEVLQLALTTTVEALEAPSSSGNSEESGESA